MLNKCSQLNGIRQIVRSPRLVMQINQPRKSR